MRVFNPTTSLDQIGDRRHHLLSELLDDDHTQYLNTTRHDVLERHPATILDPTFRHWVKVAEVIPTSDVDYIDFTGLDILTDRYYIVHLWIKNPTASAAMYYLFVEADYTTTNYYAQQVAAGGTSIGASRRNDPEIAWVGAGQSGGSWGLIFRDGNGYYRVIGLNSRKETTYIETYLTYITNNSPLTNITQLRLAASVTLAIGTDSIVTLCKPRG